LKIKIIANPAYWPGLTGVNDDNVMVSGYAYFSNGHYDFFYGFEPDWESCRTCSRFVDEVCSNNDNRPDVGYRSVIGSDGEVTNYNFMNPDSVTRGGAEVFLINRESTKASDVIDCDSNDPENQFKKNPDNFGFGNKILFKDQIYKNVTGAWRLSECYDCYANTGIIDNKLVVCNSGDHNSKQHIHVDSHFGEFYDPAKRYCTDHDTLDCIQNGAVPSNYGGELINLTRSSGTNWYLQAEVSYTGEYALSLRNGQYVGIETSSDAYSQGAYIFDVNHTGGTTTFSLLGTYEETAFSFTGGASDTWIAYQTTDPHSCCGGAAYGIDNTTKSESASPPYHVDIRKVFNNPKNKLYSNREKFQGVASAGRPRQDRRYIETSSGIPNLVGGEIVNVGELPYYGPYYDLDPSEPDGDSADSYLRYTRENQTTYKNGTCYTKSQELTIFPDSLVQSYEYDDCTLGTQHRQNIVPRLTFVYKPCNYNDSCTFNVSGHPMTAGASGMPSTLEDLKRGFGGQEIVMHVNLGSAWGNKTRPDDPCGCDIDAPPGEIPFDPEVVVPSPISYPCFPKFDLRPSGYGCQDPMYYNQIRQSLGISYQGDCVESVYDACQVRQPYTTYGYIRNLCGYKQNSRIDVLKSLKERQPDGGYTDVSGSGNIVEPMYVNFLRPLDDTGLGFPTGDSDPFQDDNEDGIPDNSGVQVNRPYWGLTDSQGRLSFPYFHTKLAYGTMPCPNPDPVLYPYIAYDTRTTITDGWPTDEVPFLIEIDHEDYCVGCSTNQIEDKQYYITIESLPAKYLHGTRTVNETSLLEGLPDINSHYLQGFKYGFNYCKYPGIFAIPKWDATTDTWLVPTGGCGLGTYVETDGTWAEANAYTGETCGCLGDGITVALRRHQLEGSSMPKYYSTDGGVNSYTSFPSDCSEPRPNGGDIMSDYTVYFAAFLHCGSLESVVPTFQEYSHSVVEYGSLSTLFNCGSCSHSYPATNSKPNLSLDFWYVRKGWESWFESYTDQDLTSYEIVNFLENGATFGFEGANSDSLPMGGFVASSLGQGACGSGYKSIMGSCVEWNAGVASACNLGVYPDWEAAASYGTVVPACTGYRDGSRTIKLSTSVPGCEGSTITLYGYSYRDSPSQSDSTDGGFNRGFPNGNGFLSGSGCCDVGCYQGKNPRGVASTNTTRVGSLPDFMTGTPEEIALAPCGTCNGYKDGLACIGVCASYEIAEGCYGRSSDTCCGFSADMWDANGLPINRPYWTSHCYAIGQESADTIGTFTYHEAVGGCPAGYYGSINASHAELFFRVGSETRGLDSIYITAWDGADIPGIGTVTKAPAHEPIARRASKMSNVGVSTCNYDSGPNKTTMVASEFARVARTNKRAGYTDEYMHMGPVECTKTLAGSEVGGTCVRPIYPNTMASISAGGTGVTTVAVNKETFYPEIMTVHKIECVGGVYALHVSREYYEHERNAYAYQIKAVGDPPLQSISKYPIYGKLEGGREGKLYINPATADNPNYYFELCDTDPTGVIFSNLDNEEVLPPWDYPIIIPMISRADYISPCYDDSGCVRADEPFNETLCVSYYDPDAYDGGSGAGASGYFQSNSSGVLSFIISNGGSGYVYEDSSGNLVSCARAIFDNPCVGLTLGVGTGIYSDYAVTGYAISNTGCASDWPGCCSVYNSFSEAHRACIAKENSAEALAACDGYTFPASTTWPVTIIGCDAIPQIRCDGITDDECPDGTPKYPNFYNGGSGTPLWNYYNLVYDLSDPDARFLSDASLVGATFFPPPEDGERPRPFPTNAALVAADDIFTGFVNGTLLTNQPPLGTDSTDFTCSYSCIRDNANCGGEFFTNKEFLPRRSYATGTKVTRYGPLSICAQTAEHSWGNWLHGHVDLTSSIINTKKMGGLDDVRYVPLVDPSRSGAYTLLTQPVGLADDIIYVAELTTLLGAKHPFFKMLSPQSLDSKSCIMPDSGCFNFLPIHNASTAKGMTEERFFSGEDVYYTDQDIIRTAISNGLVGTSGCLLNPFKIMVDVEPCSERLGHIGTSDPMNLSWVVEGVIAGVCKGWLYRTPGPCPNESSCDRKIHSLGYEAVFGSITSKKYYICRSEDGETKTCVWDNEPECPNPDPPTNPCRVCRRLDVYTYWTFVGKDGEVYIIPNPTDVDMVDRGANAIFGSHTSYDCYYGGTANAGDPHCSYSVWQDACTLGTTECPATYYNYTTKTWTPLGGQGSVAGTRDANLFCNFMHSVRKLDDVLANGGPTGCDGFSGTARGYRDIEYLWSRRNLGAAEYAEWCRVSQLINDEYECYNENSIQQCPFESVLKITVTE
jgi:hypothetical protein